MQRQDDTRTGEIAPLPASPALTPFERLRLRLSPTPAAARVWRWLAPTLVTLLAAVLRLWNLGHPHALVFDETYYVKDAWTLLHLGYEGSWPSEADAAFVAGDVMSFLPESSFVVHPPLGKWLIALGLWALGADDAAGWRLAVALAGTASVLVLFLIARRLTGSTVWASVAGGLLAIDGLGIVLSRVALLDGLLAFFVLLAFWFVLIDRDRQTARIGVAVAAAGAGEPVSWGPVVWARPWVLAAGAALGCATAVKWSGLYVLAAVGIYLVVTDALARRSAGVSRWAMDAALRQGPVAFVLLVPVAALVYLSSWTGWLLTAGGYDRQSDPNALAALWNYHEAIYRFHVGLTSEHSYASPAWQWPLLLRPTSMYWNKTEAGTAGCDAASGCVQAVSSIPNPLIWYAGVAAVVYLAVRFIRPAAGRMRDRAAAFVLVGVAATYVPWLLYAERTIFQFYTVVIVPFLILALVLALRRVAGPREATVHRRTSGQGVVLVFLAVAALLSAFWYPVWTAIDVPYDFWRLHNWMFTWI
ncbi:dolichyl-phosphate-mannose--protein mannosyltransferase [Microbacterium sp. HA-8]|uniref:dolichyl-phosphate-mannose--protein mannosyltransferase n=1 Tax=unclassified Microbacterium TaxID=2609290 RepID=UPI002600EF62|nr:phospholipid carrier-dependent glycosyltransferase [Microbacterium sp.]